MKTGWERATGRLASLGAFIPAQAFCSSSLCIGLLRTCSRQGVQPVQALAHSGVQVAAQGGRDVEAPQQTGDVGAGRGVRLQPDGRQRVVRVR